MKPTRFDALSAEEKQQLLERMIKEGRLEPPPRHQHHEQRPLARFVGVAPRSEHERILLEMICALQGGRLGVYDALKLLPVHWEQLSARLEAHYARPLKLTTLIEAPTVAALATLLEAQLAKAAPTPAVTASSTTEAHPVLSPHQWRFWFFHQLDGPITAFNLAARLELLGPLDPQRLSQALRAIYARHQVLRAYFPVHDGAPLQSFLPIEAFDLAMVDLSDCNEVQVELWLSHHGSRPLNATKGPLSRVTLLRLKTDQHLLTLCQHRMIADRQSLLLFFNEWAQRYQDLEIASTQLQFSDFARWQWHNAEHLWQDQHRFWAQQLAGIPDRHQIPTDRPRPSVQRFEGGFEAFELSPRLIQNLQWMAAAEGAQLATILLAAFVAFLSRYGQSNDIVLGTHVSARTDEPALASLLGPISNALVLRNRIIGNPTFMDLLHCVRRQASEAHRHRHIPFASVVERLQSERDLSQSPLFQIEWIWQEQQALTPIPGLTTRLSSDHSDVTLHDLGLTLTHANGAISGRFEYNLDLFDPATVTRMARHFKALVTALPQLCNAPISELPLLPKEEAETILVDWNTTAINLGPLICIHDLFHRQVQLTPEAIAVSYSTLGGGVLTYAQLNAMANSLAHALIERGIGPEQTVGLCCKRSPALVVGVVAILKAGAAYMPLDPDFPQERLAFMLHDASVPILLVDTQLRKLFEGYQGKIIALDGLGHSNQASLPEDNPVGMVRDFHRATVFYTSGSGGYPKGVVTSHRALVNRLRWAQEVFPLSGEDRFMTLAPAHFDISIWEMFAPLISGAQLVVPPADAHKDISILVRMIAENRITALHFLPSLLQSFLQETRVFSANNLRLVFCGGETLPLSTVMLFYQKLPGRLIHFYGPTEAAINVTSESCRADLQAVSIGRPIANTATYVLDPWFHPVPPGVTGELYLGGVALARGYENNPIQTAAAFVPNPFAGEHPFAGAGSRLYRTGDMARLAPGGKIIFLGRRDRQVKVHGFRVELDEIECLLERYERVAHCAVTCHTPSEGVHRLVAYVCLRPGHQLKSAELSEFLRKYLPDSMMPAAFVILEHLPVLANGKVDRKSLPKPEADWFSATVPYVPPRTREEHVLAALWAQLLGIERVGIHDNFFNLGGNSMLTIRMEAQALEAGLNLSTRKLFEKPTIAQLVSTMGENQELVLPVAPLHVQFAAQVASRGEQIALVVEGGLSWTYIQLQEGAQALVTRLHRIGIGPGSKVGICAEGATGLIGLLAALQAGTTCVPLPLNWTSEQRQQIVDQLDLDAILLDQPSTMENAVTPLLQIRPTNASPNIMNTSTCAYSELALIHPTHTHEGQIALLALDHSALTHTLASLTAVPGMEALDVLLLLEPKEPLWLLWPLLAGARLVLPAPTTLRDTVAVNRLLLKEAVTTVLLGQTVLPTFLKALRPGDSGLKLLLEGEVPALEARTLLGRYRQIWHLFGYAEACFCSARGLIDTRALEDEHAHVGVSGPLHGTWLYLLDEAMQPMRPGMIGELYIGSTTLAQGYLNQPSATAIRFLPNPFTDKPGGRVFRTHRRAFFLNDGRIFFP